MPTNRQLATAAVSRYRIGQRVSVLSPFDRSHGVPAREGRIVGAAIQSDPHGIEGTLTVDLGAGCHEYAPPSWVEPIDPLVSVCAWCDDAKQRTADAVLAGRVVTHGLCKSCEEKLR